MIEPMMEYCKQDALKSKQCMFKYDYERDKFMGPCQPVFDEYKECKQRWLELRKMVTAGKLETTTDGKQ